MSEKHAKRKRIEARVRRNINYQKALFRYQTELIIWENSEPPKRHIFKWLKWRLSKPERV